MSREVKIALLAIAALGLTFWGYKFIQGKNVLVSSNTYYVEYDNVDGLQPSSPVRIRGSQVGFVAGINFTEDYRKVKVTLDLDKEVVISKNAVAYIGSEMMGGRFITLENIACSGANCAQKGDIIQGELRGVLGTMLGQEDLGTYIDPVKEALNEVVANLNKELLGEGEETPLGNTVRDLQATMSNLKAATGQLNGIMAKSSGNITSSLESFEAIAKNLEAGQDKLNSILENTDQTMAAMANGDLDKTLQEAGVAVKQLQETLDNANKAIAALGGITEKLNNGEGTIGKLLGDEELYDQLIVLFADLDTLAQNLDDHPYNYVPLKGRKRVLKNREKDAKLEGNE